MIINALRTTFKTPNKIKLLPFTTDVCNDANIGVLGSSLVRVILEKDSPSFKLQLKANIYNYATVEYTYVITRKKK